MSEDKFDKLGAVALLMKYWKQNWPGSSDTRTTR